MPQHWDFYLCQIDDAPCTVFLDLAAEAPDVTRPECLRVRFDFHEPNEHGFPTREESAAADPVEDAIVDTLTEGLGATFVGRTTGSGMRQLYFYAANHDGLETVLGDVQDRFADYPFEVDLEVDPDWAIYKDFLYPNASELKWMQEREQEAGGPADEPA